MSGVFEQKLRRIMRHNRTPIKHEKKRSGSIDSKRLGRYGATDRLFKQKDEEKESREYNISILVDASGSMRGAKGEKSADALVLLCNSLDKIDGVSFEVTIFNDAEIQAKSFDEKYNSRKVHHMYMWCVGMLPSSTSCDGIYAFYTDKGSHDVEMRVFTDYEEMENVTKGKIVLETGSVVAGGNLDGAYVYTAFTRLKKRNGKKVLMVFSDGRPAGRDGIFLQVPNYCDEDDDLEVGYSEEFRFRSFNGNKEIFKFVNGLFEKNPSVSDHELLRSAVREVKRNKIETIGIGIQDSSVEKYYDRAYVVNKPEHIYAATADALSKVFKKES